MKKSCLFLIVFLFACLSCGRRGAAVPDPGEIRDGVYTNVFFGITMNIPQGWFSLDTRQTENLQRQGAELYEKDREIAETVAQSRSVTLLYIGRRDSVSGVNYTLQLLAEKIDEEELKTFSGKRYLARLEEAVKDLGLEPDTSGADRMDGIELGGENFARTTFVNPYAGLDLRQTMLAGVRGGYLLLFTCSYVNGTQREEMEKILATVRFGKQDAPERGQ